jgi:hypothetical protein
MMEGTTIGLFSMMTLQAKDNWSKLKTASSTFHQEAWAELGAVCVFAGLGLAATLLVALFGDVSEVAQALAMAG